MGHLPIVKQLAKSGAKLNVVNKQGQTALDLSFQRHDDVYQLLVKIEALPGDAVRRLHQQQSSDNVVAEDDDDNDTDNNNNNNNDNDGEEKHLSTIVEEIIDVEDPSI
jgi:ankyrin repeat protein